MPERKKTPLLLGLAGLAAAAFAVFHLYHVLIPFLLSFALAYVISPLIGRFEARGVRREVVVVGLYAAVLLSIVLLANTVIGLAAGQLQDLQAQGPQYAARAKSFLDATIAGLNGRLPAGLRLPRMIDPKELQAQAIQQVQNLPGYLLGVFPVLSLFFLIPFITFFLLIDGGDLIEGFIQRCPSRYVEQVLHLTSEIDMSLGNYLRGLILVALAIFCASFVGLVVLGVDQALAISLLAALSSFVPYAGAVVGAVVGGLAAGFQFGTAAAGFKVVGLFAAIRLGDEMLLQPYIAKHSVDLHPLLFLLAFMAGGELFGFVGLLFAIPVLCIVKAVLRVAWAWYVSEEAMGSPEIADAAAIPYV